MNISYKLMNLSPIKIITYSFLALIIIGSLLLLMPITHTDNTGISFIDSLFTSTSCVCVTGLTIFDTWTQWSFLGQVILIVLIQLGGLGIVSFVTGFSLILKRKLNVRELQVAHEYVSGSILDVPKLIKTILFFSLLCETLGALLLCIRFVPQFGLYGIWVAIFTAISSYCNAGFDIMGFIYPNSSFTTYCSDPLVCLVIVSLVLIGGLGFIVVADIYSYSISKIKKVHKKVSISIHSKIVLKVSTILIIFGTVLFLIFENSNTLSDFAPLEKINIALFQSVVARTAGFSTVSIADESDIMKIITIFLMFIGASPASTGGGIKTTTFAILISTVTNVLRGNNETIIKNHRIDKLTVYKAITITAVSIFSIFICTIIIGLAEFNKPFSSIDILFEATSAFGTVGLSTGITPMLSIISKLAIIFLMFLGKIGPIVLVCSLTVKHSKRRDSILPIGKVIVG